MYETFETIYSNGKMYKVSYTIPDGVVVNSKVLSRQLSQLLKIYSFDQVKQKINEDNHKIQITKIEGISDSTI